ncbi:glycosyltransferase family 4 protein [Sporosarcina limicola]|uniref:Glycosyltransferase involved in cell wall biosynthesis n=1 Tax=Sporosarcina limicola TaxID=34101 RepID=A0A927R2G0_9BACL|nr:glycosyltransferase family 4 protein [Sporosarcina limicola]MBE1553891.1 glycosyltransferase involved in cell wall biosynthesis [Sporosarcina limicola]
MTAEKMTNLHSLPIPDPYLVSATDQYYGVTSSYEEKQTKKKKKKKSSIDRAKRQKLRILITTYWNYPAVGGLQNYISTLKTGLEKLGHIVDIIAPNQFPKGIDKGLYKKLNKETKQFYINRYGCYSNKIVKENRRLSCYEMMLRNMDLEKYDILHAQDRFTANILGRLNQYYKKPLLFTPHGFMTQRKLDFNLIEQGSVEEAYFLSLDKKAIESSDHIITLCDAFRPMLKKLGAKDNKMTTIYTGIDFKSENKQKPRTKPKDKTVITCISRLRPRKGHKYLFEALALIKPKLKNVDVWIVGDGEMREELESQVQALKLSNVTFLGGRKDIPELLSQSDIFVLPTTSDTLPIAIIEAMFANKAIITSNLGGIPEIIQDDHSGLIAEPRNSQQLAEKLSLLLSDSALRETLAQNARTFAEKNLGSTDMVTKTEEVYLSIKAKEEE